MALPALHSRELGIRSVPNLIPGRFVPIDQTSGEISSSVYRSTFQYMS